jgi:hypothetical protein
MTPITRRTYLQGTASAALAVGLERAAAAAVPAEARQPINGTPPLIFADDFIERHNLYWRIEPGRKDPQPILEPKYPWDSGAVFAHGTALLDPIDGLWKIWYASRPFNPKYSRGQHDFQLTYAVSKDGATWERPLLDVVSQSGHARTNILLDWESGGLTTYPSVFVLPDAPKDRRYEMICFRQPGYFRCRSHCVQGLPLPPGKKTHQYGLFRYHSPDGIHWRPVEGPIALETADSCYIYRQPDASYVAYHKFNLPAAPGAFVPFECNAGDCRVQWRRTSRDGTRWSDKELVLAPDWRDAHDTQFMELPNTPQAGGYVATVPVYHALNQTIDLQFAASRNGREWWRPARRPCLPLEPLGDAGGGMLWPTRQLVEHDGRLYLFYAASEGMHGDPYLSEPAQGEDEYIDHGPMCRASWEIGRLWAAVPASGGGMPARLTTAVTDCAGKTLFINALTVQDGRLEAELLDPARKPIAGFTRTDCQGFHGDDKCVAVTWKGGRSCPVGKAAVRFHLARARLYGFEWRLA